MARRALELIAGLCLLAALVPGQATNFQTAGVCARCHVAQVLEWSVSGHSRNGTACQSCHGLSKPHVENERNQVKPDSPKPECATCHAKGCPKTGQQTNCQSCHHNHSLTNPAQDTLQTLPEDGRHQTFLRSMEEGEAALGQQRWAAAKTAFAEAAKLYPHHRGAAQRLSLASRRVNPNLPGVEILGSEFDAGSGLPRRVRVAATGTELVLISGGDVDLGSERYANARPVHTVHVEPFYLGRTELTQAEWNKLGVANPSETAGDALPVHNVSWSDAVEWIAKLNQTNFRLPNEAEWEFAAQGAQPSWFRVAEALETPQPVARKAPNPFGLYDMLGNVAEWTASPMRRYPFAVAAGEANRLRVLRGGSYADGREDLDPAFRHAARPGDRLAWNGFRLAYTVP